MSKLIGKQVQCTTYPDCVGVIEKYDPETGLVTAKYAGKKINDHISNCKLVRVISEREYNEITAITALK